MIAVYTNAPWAWDLGVTIVSETYGNGKAKSSSNKKRNNILISPTIHPLTSTMLLFRPSLLFQRLNTGYFEDIKYLLFVGLLLQQKGREKEI